MTTRARTPSLLVSAFGAWLMTSTTEAHAFPYAAKQGDTLASLAERFYGRVELEQVIVAANGFENQVPLLSGMRIEIPAVSYVRAEKGDSWTGLAERFLGTRERSEALALSNDTMPWIPPKAGQEIVVPYPLRYVAARGDSTASVAYRFLGRRDDAFIIDRFNGLKGDALVPGDVVLVPVTALALTDEGKEEALTSAARVLGETRGDGRERESRAIRELPQLRADLRAGNYIETIVRGTELAAGDDMSAETTADVLFALLTAYVALGEERLAEDTCIEWRRSDPDRVLDPVFVSPKILAACGRAPGPPRVSSSAAASAEPSAPNPPRPRGVPRAMPSTTASARSREPEETP